MNKIHILNTEVSNKIAAGEVVGNPASAVKELVENAIDAGANSITVEIKNGGISFIRITDNGDGMSAEDAKTAFLRHATSKILSSDDLEAIRTLGFRGEALASIAAVSKIELMTKTSDGEGFFLELHAGEQVGEQPVGCPDGTTLVVKDLFYNTPARMKFLKSDRTETGYITDIIQRLALSNPRLSIKYIADGKEKLFVSGDGKLQSCVYNIYGRDYAKASLELERSEDGIAIGGIAGKAELSRGNRSFQSFFINGRYIKHRVLTYTAEAAYGNTLMTGKFPFFVIHITLPPHMVDINVHPTKQEVKFADERAICDSLYHAIKTALINSADEVRRSFSPNSTASFAIPSSNETRSQLSMNIKTTQSGYSTSAHHTTHSGGMRMSEEAAPLNFSFSKEEEHTDNAAYKIVGQLFNTYVILELDEKIVLIDQHAAHERMIYERLLRAAKEKIPLGQTLLSPAAVTLSPEEYGFVIENHSAFTELGFEIEEFGTNAVLVRQAPEGVAEPEVRSLILELIERMKRNSDLLSNREEAVLSMISCKAAIKGNNRLSDSEITALIDDVLRTNGVNTCPHGRPLMITITKHELEKMFKRTL